MTLPLMFITMLFKYHISVIEEEGEEEEEEEEEEEGEEEEEAISRYS